MDTLKNDVRVKANEDGSVLFFSTIHNATICLIASSFPVSVDVGGVGTYNSIKVMPKKGENGLIALTLIGVAGHPSFIVGINWRDEKHFVDLERETVPSGDYVLQIHHMQGSGSSGSFLRMIHDGMIYTSDPEDKEYSFVEDPSLFLRLALGQAELEEVQDAAREAVEEATELKKLKKAHAEHVAAFHEQRKDLEVQLKAVSSERDELRKICSTLVGGISSYLDAQLFQRIRKWNASKNRKTVYDFLREAQFYLMKTQNEDSSKG